MLEPALLYKKEIEREFWKRYYSEDMLLMTGSIDNWAPDIKECPDANTRQYAITHNGRLLGYLSYRVDWNSSNVYNFALMSFDKGNIIVGREIQREMERLVERFHRIEWRMVGGNPIEKHYDRFCEKHKGKKYILRDAFKDTEGNYRNDIIYEIVNDEKEKQEEPESLKTIEEMREYLEKCCDQHPCNECVITKFGSCYYNICTDEEIIMICKAIKESEV